jgi:pilus assembly protein CpaB
LIVLSLLMAAGAAWVANRWVNGQLVTAANAEPNTQLVVAAALSIPFATKVESRHLRMIEVPAGVMPEGAFASVDEVEGKVSTTSIARGEILVTERFVEHTRGSTLAALVQENMRAITVRVNDVVGVAGFLLPGNTVDILASRKVNQQRAVTETILRDIKVLAVDQTASTDKNEPVIVRAVTLEMTPPQAEVLVNAKTEGTIQLTLRNPNEEEIVPEPEPAPEPVKKAVVKRAPPRAPTSSTVEIIRGTATAKEKTKT